MAAKPIPLTDAMTVKTFKLLFHYWGRQDAVPTAGPAPDKIQRKRSRQIRKAIQNKLFEELQAHDQSNARQEKAWRESPGSLEAIREKPLLRWQEQPGLGWMTSVPRLTRATSISTAIFHHNSREDNRGARKEEATIRKAKATA